VLLCLAVVGLCFAGSGKTHIAARIMQVHYLPQLQAAKANGEPFKTLLFLAPTNPLVAQVRAGLMLQY
jgi:ERCC4-related helicase